MIYRWLKQYILGKKLIKKTLKSENTDVNLNNYNIWHVNRFTISRGVAIGLFSAFIPLPIQMLAASLLAIFFRANLPIAVLMTWVSNPVTFLPLNYFIYKVGNYIMGGKSDAAMDSNFTAIMSHFGTSWTSIFDIFFQFGKIYFIGLAIFAFGAAIIGYLTVDLICVMNTKLIVFLKKALKK